MTRPVRIAILATVLLSSGAARAQPTGGEGLEGIGTIMVLELLVPDVRVQLHEGEKLVLSWPVHVIHARPARRMAVSPFFEPQVQTSNNDLRVLLGARAYVFATDELAVVVEGAAALGHELGTGGVAGGGILFGQLRGSMPPVGIGLIYREGFFPDGERRRDLSLDVVLSTLWMFVGK